MAEAAPITPKNGEYIGASSVLIVAWFVRSRRSSRSRVYLQVARRSVARDRRTQSDLHVTHGAKLVAHCQIWPTGLPEYSGAGHVMSDERSTRWKVAAVAACRISPFVIGCELEPPTNRVSRLIPSRLTLGSPIGCFSNLLGTVYRKGDLHFTPDGSSVISPVGNRITIFDLKNNKSMTLPVESRFNYITIDVSPNGNILVAINTDGETHIISLISKVILHKYRFKGHPKRVKFSPDGKHFAVCKGGGVFIFNAPGLQTGDYNPFIMEHAFHGATAETTCVSWSFDSKLLAVGSKDTTVKIYSLQKWANFRWITLGGHSDVIVACFFEAKQYDVYTISKNGRVCVWECTLEPDDLVEWEPPSKKEKPKDSDSEDDIDIEKVIEKTEKQKAYAEKKLLDSDDLPQNDKEEVSMKEKDKKIKMLGYKKQATFYLADEVHKQSKDAKLTTAAYHQDTHILVVGFSNGSFFLYEMPHANLIHSLSISRQRISSIALNSTGDWIAIGCSHAGQLLVWEWQSETYAMKQQGHRTNMNCLAYSPDGQYIITGGDDGKVKLWNTLTGFCTLTFHEHISSISSVLFSHNRKFVASASLDGTVRAYDLVRYRNFRTLTSPRPVQFSCLSIDASDEFIAAGGQDFFDVYLWSMKLGTLLEILSGHEGPIASLVFNPNPASTELVSASWDKTLKIWNAIENGSAHETVRLNADALCVTYKPNGEEVAVATLDGQIIFFECKTARQTGFIEGRTDLGAGRSKTDLVTAKKNLQSKCDFNQYTISYVLRIGDLKSKKNVSKLSTIKIDDESDFSIEEIDID
ncbi:Periodic tryptophan protein 2 like protein [Atta colombica]|uniref:Periodic tryptophan protein 2 like protein n=1 Tax=Atta colombica TaxID=520822 RepID=A0A195BNJ3_9HYME|nr:Periodic tryptophan protein 2 like protein [Atta colombica]